MLTGRKPAWPLPDCGSPWIPKQGDERLDGLRACRHAYEHRCCKLGGVHQVLLAFVLWLRDGLEFFPSQGRSTASPAPTLIVALIVKCSIQRGSNLQAGRMKVSDI